MSTFLGIATALSLFIGMMLLLEVGRRIAVSRARTRGSRSRAGVGVVDGAVYGLLALLLGFSFSGAAERFDHRRALIGDIANAGSTAWRRVDMLPDDRQPPIRDGLRRYLDELIAFYTAPAPGQDWFKLSPSLVRAEDDLWSQAAAACKAPGGEAARMLLLPSLNETFDYVDEERVARRMHPPSLIFTMLGIAALATALFAGYGMASGNVRNWVFHIGIAASVSIAVFVIVELEYPRLGLLRISGMDQVLVELRATMK
jgi:hypothetical protein